MFVRNSNRILISLALGLSLCLVTVVNGDFGEDFQVNDDIGDEGQAIGPEKTSVVMKGDQVYAVWQDWRNVSDNLAPDIYFARGTIQPDGNVTFEENVMVNDVPHSPQNDKPSSPVIAVGDDGTIYVAWTDTRNIDNQLEGVDVYFARSTNGGTSFEENKLIGSTKGGSGAPAIATSGNYVYIVYEHCCDPANNVLNFVFSSDKGATFSDLETIYIPSEEENGSGQPTIAAEGNNVYIAFQLKTKDKAVEVALKISNNNGGTFSDPIIINDDGEDNVQQGSISLSVSGQNIYLAWHDFRDPKGVYFTVSKDGGNSFEKNQIIVETGPNFPSPSISSYKDNVTISYGGHSEGIYGWVLLAKISNDTGNTWSDPFMISDPDTDDPDIGPRSGIGPSSVTMCEKGMGILWVDSRGGWDNNIFFDWSDYDFDNGTEDGNGDDTDDDTGDDDTDDDDTGDDDTSGDNETEEEDKKIPGMGILYISSAVIISLVIAIMTVGRKRRS